MQQQQQQQNATIMHGFELNQQTKSHKKRKTPTKSLFFLKKARG